MSMPPTMQQGVFVQPPATGTVREPVQQLGLEGMEIRFPELNLRMPSIRFPGVSRTRREASMDLDSARAPFMGSGVASSNMMSAANNMAVGPANAGPVMASQAMFAPPTGMLQTSAVPANMMMQAAPMQSNMMLQSAQVQPGMMMQSPAPMQMMVQAPPVQMSIMAMPPTMQNPANMQGFAQNNMQSAPAASGTQNMTMDELLRYRQLLQERLQQQATANAQMQNQANPQTSPPTPPAEMQEQRAPASPAETQRLRNEIDSLRYELRELRNYFRPAQPDCAAPPQSSYAPPPSQPQAEERPLPPPDFGQQPPQQAVFPASFVIREQPSQLPKSPSAKIKGLSPKPAN